MRTVDKKIVVALHEIRDVLRGEEQGYGEGGSKSGNWLMGFIPEELTKPDIFVVSSFSPSGPTYTDVTNATISEILDYKEEDGTVFIGCGYADAVSNGISAIRFHLDDDDSGNFQTQVNIGNQNGGQIEVNGRIYYIISNKKS